MTKVNAEILQPVESGLPDQSTIFQQPILDGNEMLTPSTELLGEEPATTALDNIPIGGHSLNAEEGSNFAPLGGLSRLIRYPLPSERKLHTAGRKMTPVLVSRE